MAAVVTDPDDNLPETDVAGLSAAPDAATPPPLSDAAKARLALSRQQSATFGDVVALLARSPQYRHYSLGDLEWLVVPAIAYGQFRIAEGIDVKTGNRGAVAAALWASVSEEVEQRLVANLGQTPRLQPNEWRSGDRCWLMSVAGEPRAVSMLLKQLSETQFKERPLWIAARDAGGQAVVRGLAEMVAAQEAMHSQVGGARA
jgi:hemolysin-activating ACP:hemolysin acyltransferase